MQLFPEGFNHEKAMGEFIENQKKSCIYFSEPDKCAHPTRNFHGHAYDCDICHCRKTEGEQ